LASGNYPASVKQRDTASTHFNFSSWELKLLLVSPVDCSSARRVSPDFLRRKTRWARIAFDSMPSSIHANLRILQSRLVGILFDCSPTIKSVDFLAYECSITMLRVGFEKAIIWQ
jgi:hypothetical protein